MSARGFLRDGGGTARQGKRLFLRDSGGAPRQAKRIFERDGSGIARLVYLYADEFTLNANEINHNIGYAQGIMGSMLPSATLGDGNVITQLAASTISPYQLLLEIDTAATGQVASSYIQSLSINGNSLNMSAATFSASASSASWSWDNFFGFQNLQSYAILIQRSN